MTKSNFPSDVLVFVVPHTHWDREWYLPFQKFRYQLVQVMKDLLEYMDAHSLYKFTFDGQSIVIRDFLELEPSEKTRMQRFAEEGRLMFGPWYVQPDEWLVSGESLIRNLEFGLKLARTIGKPMMVGHVPDMFGHVPQLPEIFKLFGIHHVVLWRGVPPEIDSSPFWWVAPSGTRALTTYLFDSYSNGAYLPLDDEQLEASFHQMINRSRHRLNVPLLLLMNGTDHAPPQLGLEEVLHRVREHSSMEVQLGTLQEYVTVLDQLMKTNDVQLPTWRGELRNSSKTPILSGVLSSRMYLKQHNARLERIHEDYLIPLSAVAYLLGGTPSVNRIQRSLEMLIENHSHDCIGGCSTDEVHEEMMQRFRSTEQLATSILDELKRMLSELISIPSKFIENAEKNLSTGSIALIHPHSFPFRGSVPVTFEVDPRAHGQSLNDLVGTTLKAITLRNHSFYPFYCQEIDKEIIHDYGISPFHLDRLPEMIVRFKKQGWYYHSHEVVVKEGADYPEIHVYLSRTRLSPRSLSLAEIKAQVSKYVIPRHRFIRVVITSLPRLKGQLMIEDDVLPFSWRHVMLSLEQVSSKFIENNDETQEYQFHGDHYTVKIHDSGIFSVNLTSMVTGTKISFPSMLFFEDEGDAGDEYNHSPVMDLPLRFDQLASWKIIESSSFHQKLLLRFELPLPTELTPDRLHRSEQLRKCTLKVYLTLYKTLPRMDFNVFFNNEVKDHRLTVGFRFPFLEHTLHCSSAFYVIPRTFPRGGCTKEYAAEKESQTVPQREFSTLLHDPLNLGITVINDGLPEVELVPRSDVNVTELKITLLRCVGWLSRDDLTTRVGHAGPAIETPGAQCLGNHSFRFSLCFHSSRIKWSEVHAMSKQFLSPPLSIIPSSINEKRTITILSTENTLFHLSNDNVVVSAMEPSNDGFMMRLVNYSANQVTIDVKTPLRKAHEPSRSEDSKRFSEETYLLRDCTLAPWEIKNVQLPLLDNVKAPKP